MEEGKVIQPAQLLGKDPAMLSRVMAAMLLLVLISTYCICGGLLIFLRFGDIELLEIFLGIICASFQEYRF